MTGTFKYILGIVSICTGLLVSCNDNTNDSPGTGDGEGEVEIRFHAPVTYAETAEGSPGERAINEVDLLVFKNDKYLYHRPAHKSSAESYRSTLKLDNDLTLYFLVNSRELITNNSQLVEGNSWENIVRPSLLLKDPAGLIGSESLPMWAIKDGVTIVDSHVNQLDNIFLLRAVASVDVFNEADPADFTLQYAYLYFVPDQAYLAPSDERYDPAQKGVDKPEAPAAMVNLSQGLGTDEVDDESIAHKLYLYENDADDSQTDNKRYSRLVVGGSYQGGATTWYPVDFLEDDLYNVLQVTRNYKYVIIIDAVKSPGYPDPDTASEEYDSRMIVNVIDWNLKEEKEIVFDGPFYISAESKTVYLGRPAGSSVMMEFSTNIAWEDLKKELIESGNGTMVDDNTIIYNDRFKVEFLFDEKGKIDALRITALEDYDPENAEHNTQVLKIWSSRIEMEITIKQLSESPSEWIDGGKEDVEIGE